MIGISIAPISRERSDHVTTFSYSKEKWHLAKLREYSMQTQLPTMRGDGRLSTMRGELEDEDSKRKTQRITWALQWRGLQQSINVKLIQELQRPSRQNQHRHIVYSIPGQKSEVLAHVYSHVQTRVVKLEFDNAQRLWCWNPKRQTNKLNLLDIQLFAIECLIRMWSLITVRVFMNRRTDYATFQVKSISLISLQEPIVSRLDIIEAHHGH
jgi:hypothetical protein